MSDRIDEILRDSDEKHCCAKHFDEAEKGVLILRDENGEWGIYCHGIDSGDMAFALAVLQDQMWRTFRHEEDKKTEEGDES